MEHKPPAAKSDVVETCVLGERWPEVVCDLRIPTASMGLGILPCI